MDVNNILHNLGGSDTIKVIYKRENFLQHWVPTRHRNIYTWIAFGWRQLPSNCTSYDST